MSLSGHLPLEPRVFLMDENVRMMTMKQAWCYLRLLMHQWEEGSIPNCPKRLAAILTEGPRCVTHGDIVGLSSVDDDPLPDSKTMYRETSMAHPYPGSIWKALKPCFEVDPEDETRLRNPRCKRDREQWKRKHQKWSSAGKRAGRASAKARQAKEKRPAEEIQRSFNDRSTDDQRIVEVHSNDPSTSSSSSPLPLRSPNEERTPTESYVGMADATSDGSPENGSSAKTKATELGWRVKECWLAFLGQRVIHWQDKEGRGKGPGRAPVLTPERRKLITEALRRHDVDILGQDQRDEWSATSRVRAAGCGIFLDKHMTAEKDGNRAGEGGIRYLEPERCWKIMRGKPDPVDRFADLYFAKKERQDARTT